MPDPVTHDAGVVYEALMPGVVQLRLNRPDRLNALGVEMVGALSEAVARAIDDKARVLVVRGTGRSFCAGADLKERQMMDKAARFAHNRAINAAVNAVAAAPMPTIAVLNGLALGGGCELALACDIRIAAEGIQIGLTEARLGAIPGAGGTQRLPRLIGLSRALDMMFSAEPIEARRAEAIGLVNMVVSDGELDAFIGRYAALLASRSPRAAAALKQVVHEGTELPLADGLAKERDALAAIFTSADYAEGLAAFTEKRPPRFSNEGLDA